MRLTLYRCFTLLMLLFATQVTAEIKGRADLGAVYAEIDILKSGKTQKTLHMKGLQFNAYAVLYQGFTIKPSALWVDGHGGLATGTIAAGYMIPCWKFKFFPNVGITWSYLHTSVKIEDFGLLTGRAHYRERFRSNTPFLGLDVCFTITDKLSLIALYQYGWAHTHTKLRHTPIKYSEKSHSCGPNYALSLDYSLTDHWSLTLAGAYNITLSKEKHGLRGKGLKLGAAYFF